jgi:hypothetical protein
VARQGCMRARSPRAEPACSRPALKFTTGQPE